MYPYDGPGWHYMWGMGWVIPVLFMIGFIFLMIRLRHGPRRDRSLDILRERYARGEITKEDFERMKRDLA